MTDMITDKSHNRKVFILCFNLAKCPIPRNYCAVICCCFRRMQRCQCFPAPTPCCAGVRKSHAIKWQMAQAGLMSKPTSFQSSTFLHVPKSSKLLVWSLCINKENDFVLFFISENLKRSVKVSLLSFASERKLGPTACYQWTDVPFCCHYHVSKHP